MRSLTTHDPRAELGKLGAPTVGLQKQPLEPSLREFTARQPVRREVENLVSGALRPRRDARTHAASP
jgi:hypothetical protein